MNHDTPDTPGLQIDPHKVIELQAQEIGRLSHEVIMLKAALATVQEQAHTETQEQP